MLRVITEVVGYKLSVVAHFGSIHDLKYNLPQICSMYYHSDLVAIVPPPNFVWTTLMPIGYKVTKVVLRATYVYIRVVTDIQ